MGVIAIVLLWLRNLFAIVMLSGAFSLTAAVLYSPSVMGGLFGPLTFLA